jgi:hypothetical protein
VFQQTQLGHVRQVWDQGVHQGADDGANLGRLEGFERDDGQAQAREARPNQREHLLLELLQLLLGDAFGHCPFPTAS